MSGDELATFLLARIGDDEAAARDLGEHEWGQATDGWWGGLEWFASRHDPARVLAECEAKWRIVKEWGWSETLDGDGLMRIMALPYADHPDYRQEWKP